MSEQVDYPELVFVVAGEAVPKGRPRFFSRKGQIRVITPEATQAYERKVAAAARLAARQLGGWRVGQRVPLAIDVLSVHPRPSNRYRIADEGRRSPKTTKPDADNLLKSIMDGLQRAKLFHDDSQIVAVSLRKVHAKILDRRERLAEAPYAHVRLRVVPALDDHAAEYLLQGEG